MFANPSENTADKFRGELSSGERILWSGQPQQGFMLRPSDAFIIPFSLIWGAVVFPMVVDGIVGDAPSFFRLWIILFGFAALYFVVGRFIVDAAVRRKTYYALTNERVIIISGLFTYDVKTLFVKKIQEINLSTKRNGKGTITFGASPQMGWMNAGGAFPNGRAYLPPSFEMIEDAKSVYQKIKNLQREGVY